MTFPGPSYQDYLSGKFDGINHEDEAQTRSFGNKISHRRTIHHCPGRTTESFYAWAFSTRSMPAPKPSILRNGVWVRGGYSEGFKREWQAHYGEPWQPPHSSVDAQWCASKLKIFPLSTGLRSLIMLRDYNHRTGRRCVVLCAYP